MKESPKSIRPNVARGLATRRNVVVSPIVTARIDTLLAELMAREFPEEALTRSQIKQEIEAGNVSFQGKVVTSAGMKISTAGVLEFYSYRPASLTYEPDSSIQVVYEDHALIVVNKPAGLSVHPGAGQPDSTLVNKLLPKLAGTDAIRPGIVHRLDKDTTGLLVVAKTVQAHSMLAAQFANHSIDRAYKALVLATPKARKLVMERDEGVIKSELLRVGKKITVNPAGRRAVTHWRVIERLGYGALVEFRLETGRTHQIRVHAASIHCPVIGDRTYGDFSALPNPLFKVHREFGRQALHAFELGFTHPTTLERMLFQAKLPADFESLIEEFKSFGAGQN